MIKAIFIAVLSIFVQLLTANYIVNAQDTGSFNKSIEFNSETRIVSFFVPNDYNPETKYRLMICLHGLGDTCTTFRNALISGLKWNTLMPNTIFAFPDGGTDTYSDFYSPAGDEVFIAEVMKYTMANYSIDTNDIILEGFSLGGRSALKYGLDNPGTFRGLLLNTPAIQGIKDADRNGASSLMYQYENASKIPIAINYGVLDEFYDKSIAKMYDYLVKNNGIAMLEGVPGLEHNIAGNTYTQKCLDFIYQPSTKSLNMEIHKIVAPLWSCSQDLSTKVCIRNTGNDTLTKVAFSILINGESTDKDMEFSGLKLGPFEYAELPLSYQFPDYGKKNIVLKTSKINNAGPESSDYFDVDSSVTLIQETGVQTPFYEGFEQDDSTFEHWVLKATGNFSTWEIINFIKKTGSYSIVAINTILLFENQGFREELLSPFLDLTSVNNPEVSFDVAFNYMMYTPPYFTQDTYFSDTLEIAISTDCGENYEILYSKSAAELATASKPITNPLSLTSCIYQPKNSEWRKEVIDLSNYGSSNNAIIKFTNISGLGGCTYIDNIKFATQGTSDVRERPAEGKANIYPNPASDRIYIESGSETLLSINIYDLNGRKLISMTNPDNGGRIALDVSALADGVYITELVYSEEKIMNKLIISK